MVQYLLRLGFRKVLSMLIFRQRPGRPSRFGFPKHCVTTPTTSSKMSTALQRPADDAAFVELPSGSGSPVRLTRLEAGESGRLHATRLVDGDREMLRALGLAERSRFRVCKAGDPWILKVGGTRVGISDAVARRILVIRECRPEQ